VSAMWCARCWRILPSVEATKWWKDSQRVSQLASVFVSLDCLLVEEYLFWVLGLLDVPWWTEVPVSQEEVSLSPGLYIFSHTQNCSGTISISFAKLSVLFSGPRKA
jgi:hypothetical protein